MTKGRMRTVVVSGIEMCEGEKALRGHMSEKALTASFNEWMARDLVGIIDDLRERSVAAEKLAEAAYEVDEWAEQLGYFAEEGTQLAPVFQRLRAALAEWNKIPALHIDSGGYWNDECSCTEGQADRGSA